MADMNNFDFVTLTKEESGTIAAYLNIGMKKKKKPKYKQLNCIVEFILKETSRSWTYPCMLSLACPTTVFPCMTWNKNV